MRNNFDIKTLADYTTAVAHYQALFSYFTQLDPGQRDTLDAFFNKLFPDKKDYYGHGSRHDWSEIDTHLVSQMWGNTSGGWQGIGGAAMTNAYTLVIENRSYGFIAVYYGGQLAYMAYMDELLKDLLQNRGGYRGLPGMGDCSRRLNIIYKKQK